MMNLLEKLDNIQVSVTRNLPSELCKHIEGLHALYALNHRILMKSFLPLDAEIKETLSVQAKSGSVSLDMVMAGEATDAEGTPHSCLRVLCEARNTIGAHIDRSRHSFLEGVQAHVGYKYPLIDSAALQQLRMDDYKAARKWHSSYRVDEALPEPFSCEVLDINSIFDALEAAMNGMTMEDLQRKNTLDKWDQFIGVNSSRPREIKLAKKKNYGKVVRFTLVDSYYNARPRMDYFAEMLGYFEKSAWGEPLPSMHQASQVNGVFKVPDTWKHIVGVEVFENGNVAIKFKNGHTAAQFVREICKRDPDTCQ